MSAMMYRALSSVCRSVLASSCRLSALLPHADAAGLACQRLRRLTTLQGSLIPSQVASLQAASHTATTGASDPRLAGMARELAGQTATLLQQRGISNRPMPQTHKPKPRFLGGKLKPYSSYKQRFKVTGTGKVMITGPGSVHKKFVKSGAQRRRLNKPQLLHVAYAKVVKKLGFKMRAFQ